MLVLRWRYSTSSKTLKPVWSAVMELSLVLTHILLPVLLEIHMLGFINLIKVCKIGVVFSKTSLLVEKITL